MVCMLLHHKCLLEGLWRNRRLGKFEDRGLARTGPRASKLQVMLA